MVAAELRPIGIDLLYPTPSTQQLQEAFKGRSLRDLPSPAAVIDRAILEVNCYQMLENCQALDISLRPHTKTHKLQVGETTKDVKFVVSTIAEIEGLRETLLNKKLQGKQINILYGLPLPPSACTRLASLAKELGPQTISVLIDHVDQLNESERFLQLSGQPLQVFLKIDTGYHRAGLDSNSQGFSNLLTYVSSLQKSGSVNLVGLYSHAGHSYGSNSNNEALEFLLTELEELKKAAHKAITILNEAFFPKLTLSVGATPTASSIKALLEDVPSSRSDSVSKLQRLVSRINQDFTLELHAGVYPILDMQQLATQAMPLTTSDVALTILTEVNSLYPHRSPPEALIAAGSLALGREPCKSYPGFGIVSDWGFPPSVTTQGKRKEMRSGWQVGRISQEHGILTRDPEAFELEDGWPLDLEVGQKVRIWPNHACIAGAMFGFYLVVDSRLEGREDEVIDVWVRWRGW
ncbi:uncharacterized protein KY384_002636 [Bacidia gigantensis]|uniref:uncharacterized protein n=1 Tax=Bacidia gigantensis TaxID=2732470 RepID=UPI001D05C146|nr:uncharacterized protein KY384_002636 [Bacidia gigantensis]KAG8532758.1 hypothetical protein KY384_002636 [Bacidia gigantensis]